MTPSGSATDQNDLRFQFKVIEGLSESVRDMARAMSEMQKTQVGMLERLARLEAGTTADTLKVHDLKITDLDARLDALFRDKDRRDGATGVAGFILKFGPVIFSAFAAVWLFGRSLGVVPAPPVASTHVEAVIRPDERSIQGTVGGKP